MLNPSKYGDSASSRVLRRNFTYEGRSGYNVDGLQRHGPSYLQEVRYHLSHTFPFESCVGITMLRADCGFHTLYSSSRETAREVAFALAHGEENADIQSCVSRQSDVEPSENSESGVPKLSALVSVWLIKA
ncbi:hypothetical protein EMWEY_00039510 [Eimeria maxima]|uniref:Uncharacterized protein n=1 Tax=Eimeria maxima TaxID=5804 RepID=U6MFN7_EIMMA|nr:hypothetical protein EMWEY_00039510 [Eimeria maxima]CDJ61274.1 hypothetical protein EMWEY_00039510 [Eimeria maxima]